MRKFCKLFITQALCVRQHAHSAKLRTNRATIGRSKSSRVEPSGAERRRTESNRAEPGGFVSQVRATVFIVASYCWRPAAKRCTPRFSWTNTVTACGQGQAVNGDRVRTGTVDDAMSESPGPAPALPSP